MVVKKIHVASSRSSDLQLARRSLDTEIRPICYVGMLLGCFPHLPDAKKPTSVITSSVLAWIYSLCVYIVLCYMAICATVNLPMFNMEELPLEDVLANILQFSHRTFFVVVVPISWYNAIYTKRYLDKWLPFLSKYYTVTGRTLSLNVRKICLIYFCVATFGLFIFFIVCTPLSVSNFIWEVIPSAYGDSVIGFNAFLLLFTCFSCKTSFQSLRNYAGTHILRSLKVSSISVSRFRYMYSQVSFLVDSFGKDMFMIFNFVLISQYFVFILSIFSAVIGILEHIEYQKYLIFVGETLISLFVTLVICFCTEMVSREVSNIMFTRRTISQFLISLFISY